MCKNMDLTKLTQWAGWPWSRRNGSFWWWIISNLLVPLCIVFCSSIFIPRRISRPLYKPHAWSKSTYKPRLIFRKLRHARQLRQCLQYSFVTIIMYDSSVLITFVLTLMSGESILTLALKHRCMKPDTGTTIKAWIRRTWRNSYLRNKTKNIEE